MDAGQLRSYTVLVATIPVVNVKIISGHDFSGSGEFPIIGALTAAVSLRTLVIRRLLVL
jgi:hypothetical protein